MISTETKLNMSLDEINYVENLEKKINDLNEEFDILNYKNKFQETELNILKKINQELYNKYIENVEIVDLECWKFHQTETNNEFVSGYRFNSNNVYETSNIISKTACKNGIFVITKNEHIYYLAYNESY